MTYVVQGGDTMYLIAQKYGVSLPALLAANPQVKDPNLIYPGQLINIPVRNMPSPMPPPMPGWCTMILTPVHPKCGEPGCALIRQSMPHIMVATMGMPDPSTLTDCAVYTAWVMDETWTMDDGPGMVVAWFDLLPAMGKGFWINHANPKALSMREHVLVTAENQGHPAQPSTVRMLHGNVRQCCRRDP